MISVRASSSLLAQGSRRARMARSKLLRPAQPPLALPQLQLRSFAADAAVVPKQSSGGAGLLQRLSSFLVGAGLTALVTQLFILDEVRKGNMLMLGKQAELEKRLAKLEKK